jgi:hypothetical protein
VREVQEEIDIGGEGCVVVVPWRWMCVYVSDILAEGACRRD